MPAMIAGSMQHGNAPKSPTSDENHFFRLTTEGGAGEAGLSIGDEAGAEYW